MARESVEDALAKAGRLHDCLRAWAEARPRAEAAMEPGRRLDYAQLRDAVEACAAALLAAGLERGDRVATLATPGVDFLVTFLATAAAGGIWVGLNPRYAEPELDALVARIEPRIVFFAAAIEGRDYRAWAARLPAGVATVALGGADVAAGATYAAAHGAALARRLAQVDPADPCLMVFTSGSTGAPKGALISQAALVGASRVQLRVWPAEPLRVLDNLPINHIGCVGDLACYALVGGGTLVFLPRFDPDATLAAIRDERVTVWGQVPTMFQLALDAPGFDPGALASLRLVFWGGAHASPALVERLRGLAPRLATSYGQTETVGSVTFTASDADDVTLSSTVGRAVPPYAIRIADEAGQPVPAGTEGEVQVRTPYGMTAYWRDPEATAGVLTPDGWRRTGDVGVLGEDGGLRLLGRVHDVFKSGGYNLHPPEIEAALAAHPAIREASVVGVPDPLFGHAGIAFLVSDGDAPTEDELRAHLRARIANYKVPKRFFFVEALPRLPVGKVDKRALRAEAQRRK